MVFRGFGTIGAVTGFRAVDAVQIVHNAIGTIGVGRSAGIGSAGGVYRGSYGEKHYK